jgi:hypothetical protein
MDDFETIRDALGAPERDDAAKARARERLRRRIEEERRSGTSPPGAVGGRAPRPAHRRRYTVLIGVAAALAFGAIVLQVVLPSGQGGPAVSAASELRRLADLASTIQPIEPGAGSLYTDVETQGIESGEDLSSGLSWDLLVRERLQTWVATDGSGRQVRTIERVDFATPQDRTRWIRAGRQPLPASSVDRYGRGGLLIVDVDGDAIDPRRRAGDRPRLRLALPQVRPGRIAGAEAALGRLGGDVDDPRARNGTEGGQRRVVGHLTFRPIPVAIWSA